MPSPVSAGAAWMHDAKRLAEALGLSSRDARAEVELLLVRALDIPKARLLARPERAAEAGRNPRYLEYLERRLAGEPIAYILGEREFYGLGFRVTPDVLIPRPETELLVELALARIPEGEPTRVLDVGTGSGCIAVAIAHLRPCASVVATDISAAALQAARENADRHAAQNVEFRSGDGLAPVRGERFDLILSNPPYIAQDDPHLLQGDLRFEPKLALTSGADGLVVLRAIIAQAPAQLKVGGWLLLEHGYDQAEPVRALLASGGLAGVFTERDLAGQPRVSGGRVADCLSPR
jgi:release factor glutamine methyltransferase